MNKWKIAFIGLVVLIAVAIIWVSSLLMTTPESYSLAERGSPEQGGQLFVETSKSDFEALANKYIQEAVSGQAIPLQLEVEEKIALTSELTVFSLTIPVQMYFDPIVQEDGNIQLKQNQVDIGQLSIPPEQVLKLLRDSVDLPNWMVVSPADESVFIDLEGLPIDGDFDIRAQKIDLENDEIILSVTIPTNQ
ncbi:YpmS family protein [Chryseomicrobium sp. FSL W7-1435]|uniref:YpmS family protein n=1 Tax=Chryseomicrobium sp. FSL W7-1435 TaxID=2921704 RepID=UPI00315A52CF